MSLAGLNTNPTGLGVSFHAWVAKDRFHGELEWRGEVKRDWGRNSVQPQDILGPQVLARLVWVVRVLLVHVGQHSIFASIYFIAISNCHTARAPGARVCPRDPSPTRFPRCPRHLAFPTVAPRQKIKTYVTEICTNVFVSCSLLFYCHIEIFDMRVWYHKHNKLLSALESLSRSFQATQIIARFFQANQFIYTFHVLTRHPLTQLKHSESPLEVEMILDIVEDFL